MVDLPIFNSGYSKQYVTTLHLEFNKRCKLVVMGDHVSDTQRSSIVRVNARTGQLGDANFKWFGDVPARIQDWFNASEDRKNKQYRLYCFGYFGNDSKSYKFIDLCWIICDLSHMHQLTYCRRETYKTISVAKFVRKFICDNHLQVRIDELIKP